MMRTIKIYRLTSKFLVLLYLNFYFFSPFIHEHPVETKGQVNSESVIHSHLKSFVTPISNGSNYLTDEVSSHTHNFAFDIPIVIQQSQELNIIFSSNRIFSNDILLKKNKINFDVVKSAKPLNQVLREKYVQFATNNSPPLTQSSLLS